MSGLSAELLVRCSRCRVVLAAFDLAERDVLERARLQVDYHAPHCRPAGLSDVRRGVVS